MRIEEWYSKIPLISLMFVILGLTSGLSPIDALIPFLTCTGYSVFLMLYGYTINDYSDRDADISVGKDNIFKDISPSKRITIVLLLALPLFMPLILFPSLSMLCMLMVNLFVATFYSLRPLRFKERGILGLFASSFAQRCSPLLLIPLMMPVSETVLILCCTICFFLGMRYIFIHQINDCRNDSQTGIVTFALTHNETAKRCIYLTFLFESAASMLLIALVLSNDYGLALLIITSAILVESFLILTLRTIGSWPFFDYVYVPLMSVYTTFLPLSAILCALTLSPWYLPYILFIAVIGNSFLWKNCLTIARASSAYVKIRREKIFDKICSGSKRIDGICLLNVKVDKSPTDTRNEQFDDSTRILYSPTECSIPYDLFLRLSAESGRYHLEGYPLSKRTSEAKNDLGLYLEEFSAPGDIYSFERRELRGSGVKTSSDIPSSFLKKPTSIDLYPGYSEAIDNSDASGSIIEIWGKQVHHLTKVRPETFISVFPICLVSLLFLTFTSVILAIKNPSCDLLNWSVCTAAYVVVSCCAFRCLILHHICKNKSVRRSYLKGLGMTRLTNTRIYSLNREFIETITILYYLSAISILFGVLLNTLLVIL